MLKKILILVFVIAAVAVMAQSPRAIEIGKQFNLNRVCCDLSLAQALRLTWQEAIGGVTFPSAIGQEK